MKKLLICILLPMLLCSCLDDKYDLDNIDDSGSLSPALTLPIGTLRTNVMDLIAEAGIDKDLLQTAGDTIYIVYENSTSLNPAPVPVFGNNGILNYIPGGIQFSFDNGSYTVEPDIFSSLASSGSVLYPSNPKISFEVRNYIGADISIDVNSMSSYGNGQKQEAVFAGGETSYPINVAGAEAVNSYTSKTVVFDRVNGGMHNLFSNSPESFSFDFGIDLQVPDDNKSHFIVKDKYVDLNYEIRIPMTFGAGTRLASADTLDLDLSGDGFVNSLDELVLWIDYENRLRTTADLDVVFLDENNSVIPGLDKNFHINAAPSTKESVKPSDGIAAEGKLTLKFNAAEFDKARDTRYVILRTVLKAEGEVNIRPSDYINLKLSAYSKVNISDI